MTILQFLKNPLDHTNFDMISIIGIDKNSFQNDIFNMMYNKKYENMSCSDFKKEIEKKIYRQEKSYLYIYENYIIKDVTCKLPIDTENKCYNGRVDLSNNRINTVSKIIEQMRNELFCQKYLFLSREVLYFQYYETGFNNSPNQIGLKIYCWVNE